MRALQGLRRDADFTDAHIFIDAATVFGIDRVHVRVDEVRRWNRPVFALVAEGVFLPRHQDNIDKLGEVFTVHVVVRTVAVPITNGIEVWANTEVVHPAGLIATNQSDSQAAPEHVIERGGVFGYAQRVLGRRPPNGHTQPPPLTAP